VAGNPASRDGRHLGLVHGERRRTDGHVRVGRRGDSLRHITAGGTLRFLSTG
jgi:hypothetical protein